MNQFGSDWRHAIISMDGETAAKERLSPALDVTFPQVDIRKGDLLGNVRRFRRVFKLLQPTTLLTHNFGSIEWAIANRPAMVRHVHVEDGFGPEERNSQIPRRVWLRRIFLRGRPVILPSRTLMDIARTQWRLSKFDLNYVPNGIDLDRFATSTAWQDWPGDGPVIGTIAALRPEKNVGRLIRAFAILAALRPAKLVLVGDGAQRAELESLTAELGLQSRVFFAGHVAQPVGILKSFDIFAMSSDTEQMPISLLEAMAAGLPTAATNVGDILAMIPETGREFIVPCCDEALANALLGLVDSPAVRRDLGRANQAKAFQSFGQAEMLNCWSSLLAGRHSKVGL